MREYLQTTCSRYGHGQLRQHGQGLVVGRDIDCIVGAKSGAKSIPLQIPVYAHAIQQQGVLTYNFPAVRTMIICFLLRVRYLYTYTI